MSTYTPFDNLTDEEFLRWLELNLQDSRKDAIIDRIASDVKRRNRRNSITECPTCGEDLT